MCLLTVASIRRKRKTIKLQDLGCMNGNNEQQLEQQVEKQDVDSIDDNEVENNVHETVPSVTSTSTSITTTATITTTNNTPPAVMRGWIQKEGGAIVRSFSARYFILKSTPNSTIISYYLKEPRYCDDDSAIEFGIRGKLDLRGGTFSRSGKYYIVTGVSNAGKRKMKRYILDISACEEADEWIKSFHDHMAFANPETNRVGVMGSQQHGEVTTPASSIKDDNSSDTFYDNFLNDATDMSVVKGLSPITDTKFIDQYSAHQYIYVYERWQPLLEWGNSYPGHLLPTDKGPFSNGSCTVFSHDMNKVIPSLPHDDWYPLTDFMPDFEVSLLQYIFTHCKKLNNLWFLIG